MQKLQNFESFAKNLSHSEKIQNSCEFHMKIISHNLMQIFRLETLYKTKYENCRTATLRRLFVNVWWRIVKHARQITIYLSSAFAYKKRFCLVMDRLENIKFNLIT